MADWLLILWALGSTRSDGEFNFPDSLAQTVGVPAFANTKVPSVHKAPLPQLFKKL